MALSHYKFRMKLKQITEREKNKIEVIEYLTSKHVVTGKINDKLGRSKTFNRNKCL